MQLWQFGAGASVVYGAEGDGVAGGGWGDQCRGVCRSGADQPGRNERNSELDGLADGFARGDLNYRAWAVHDQDAVYVAVDVVDDHIFTDSAETGSEDGSTWEDDSVEIFFDADHSKDLARGAQLYEGQYVLTANGAWRDAEANNPTFGEEGDWYAVSKPSFKGYQVEFKIKKTALLDPADGTVMGFNVAVNDDDGANRKVPAQLGRPSAQRVHLWTDRPRGAGRGSGEPGGWNTN
jgi:hypothetical protein